MKYFSLCAALGILFSGTLSAMNGEQQPLQGNTTNHHAYQIQIVAYENLNDAITSEESLALMLQTMVNSYIYSLDNRRTLINNGGDTRIIRQATNSIDTVWNSMHSIFQLIKPTRASVRYIVDSQTSALELPQLFRNIQHTRNMQNQQVAVNGVAPMINQQFASGQNTAPVIVPVMQMQNQQFTNGQNVAHVVVPAIQIQQQQPTNAQTNQHVDMQAIQRQIINQQTPIIPPRPTQVQQQPRRQHRHRRDGHTTPADQN